MKCPTCNTEMEEDPEDSSEWYCSKCNYTYRYDKYGQRVADEPFEVDRQTEIIRKQIAEQQDP